MTGKYRRHPPSKTLRAIFAGIAGILIGALGGALIWVSFYGRDGVWIGAFLGALIIGPAEAISDAAREEGQSKPFIYRMLMLSFAGAVVGSILGLIFKNISLIVLGLITGFLFSASSLRINKVLLGLIAGGVIGLLASYLQFDLNAAIVGALVVFVYRVLDALLFREQGNIQLMAERVPRDEIRYVVPFEANSKYVGADYFKDLARSEDGIFKRNQSGIGIVETLDNMRGPLCDPNLVNPLIREFYEHTSNFKLNIKPEWKIQYKPLFWIFKRYIAQQIGQANLPFNTEEAQEGVVSYIDTIDFSCDQIIDLRGWVRAFEKTGEAIYVGIYTTFQHQGVGYVSVGFPLPDSNFTATLLPRNHNGDNFILTSRDTGYAYPGHYLTSSENETLTVIKLPTFNEEIEVYVEDEQLRTDHRFYLAGLNFLTLHYSMEKIDSQ